MRGGGKSGRSHVLFFVALSYFPKRRVYSSVPPPRRCQFLTFFQSLLVSYLLVVHFNV